MKISKGKVKVPHLLLVFGIDGIGKSTFAAGADTALFIGAENGTNNIDTSRVEDIHTYEDVALALDYLIKNETEYKTIVIDSLDWLESLLYVHLLKKHNKEVVEDIGGGFGKYVNVILAEWKLLINKLSVIRDIKKINVILIAHSQIKVFNDPLSLEPYERYVLKLQDKTSALFREFVDAVLFLNYETFVKKEKNMSKAKAFSDGERYIFTQKTAAYDAKNRFGLPPKIKLTTFKEFEHLIHGASASETEVLKQEIDGMILDIKDAELLPKIKTAIENAGNDFGKLTAIKNRLQEITNV